MSAKTPIEPARISEDASLHAKKYLRNRRPNLASSFLGPWKKGGVATDPLFNKDKPFSLENVFFRTIDSGRLLPMFLATFRIQLYAHKSHWKQLDKTKKSSGYIAWTVAGLMHDVLLFRNRHDTGGADVPMLLTNWSEKGISVAIEYWIELSKGQWSDEEKLQKYNECNNNFCRRLQPSFSQVDHLIRALLSDPAVGYILPFIILIPYQKIKGARAHALFSDPSFVPPHSLTHYWPNSCNGPECREADCGLLNMAACRSLSTGSAMVRERTGIYVTAHERRTVCNLWGCEVQHLPEDGKPLQRCQKCKEVLYCSRIHQSLDWELHKTVCELCPKGSSPKI